MTPELPPADLMTDRRRHRRRLAVKELIGLHLGVGNRGIVVDVSEGGLRVQAASRVQLLPASLVRFQIPGCSTPVAASCEVAWADDFGKAGLRFTGFSGNSLHDLRRWLMTTTAPVLVEKREEIRAQARPLPLPIPKPQVVTAPPTQRAGPLALPTAAAVEEAPPGGSGNPETFAARLHAMAQNLMRLTSAEGAVVALRQGKQIVCRASVGVAPAVGAPLQQDSGLAGECVRRGVLVWCPDTNEDERVNREVCQQLNLRATVLAPIVRGGQVQGMLEVFSSRPHIFDRGDVMAMTRLADIVAGMLEKGETAPFSQPAASSVVQEPEAQSAPLPAPPETAPTAAPRVEAQAAARPSREAALRLPQPQNGMLVCDACGHRNPESARDCEKCDVPLRVPELEALLDKSPQVSKLLLAAFMVVAPLGCFHAGHEMGVLMRKPAVQQTQPARTDAARPEVARQM